ncbi:ABC transporter permease [Hyphomicrobiales bacterium]|nr:ABC transporter permease [Hyphomicrobiales bacterium]CAH1694360.1 ABC transporter permease [Hyphomicrobiales bacterium]
MALTYAVRRLLQGLIVIFGATTLVFVVSRLVGDPVGAMLPIDVSAADRERLTIQLGLDRPVPEQFVNYLWSLMRGDFGISLWQDRPVATIIAERLPPSLLLCGVAVLLAAAIGIPAGLVAASRPNGWLDHGLSVLGLLGLSVPQFWLALILIMVFSVGLGWFPTSGSGSAPHLVLPAIALALPALGRIATVTRASMLEELESPHIRTALSKGVPFRSIVLRHGLRNIGVAVATIVGWELTRALAGYNIVVETIFGWPGIGQVALQAIERSDLVLIQAVVFVIALIVVILNLTVDLLLKLIDPRIEY